jgi:predicted NAD/FAD-binding protein
MRIAIVGGGVAGLGCAWLLEGQHDVTLFERQPQLGGHARTIELTVDGASALVETGFEFFADSLWPTFNRLLGALGVEVTEYPCRIVVHRKGAPDARLLQPMHLDGRFAPSRLTPRALLDFSQLGLVLASVAPLMRARDTSVTVQQALSRVPMTRSFREELLFPFLLSGWCIEPDEFRELAAYNVLGYTFRSMTLRPSVPMHEVVGGLRAYVAALTAQIPRTTLRQAAEITSIERDDAGFTLRERDGQPQRFDQLVLATNAPEAAKLLRDVRGTEATRALLERIGYVRTPIAVHGDRRFMPADQRDWSIVNIRHDGRYAHTTVWKPWRGPRLFRSWLTFEQQVPEPLYERVEFDHPKPTPDYFAIQRALASQQGQAGIWLAGVHMHDIDSHESALVSGANVARRLAPQAPRLQRIGLG